MIRASILGLGSYVPERVVPNEEIPFLNDQHTRCDEEQTETGDEWIRSRSGIQERRYVPVDSDIGSSDLGLKAAEAALADAGVDANEVDCIVFATLSPDILFPGNAVFLQSKLGIDGDHSCPCYDIRQQCSGFIYGLEMADAFIRAGIHKKVLVVGAELHSHSLDFTTRGRDVMVLFGDGAGAVLVGAMESDDKHSGIVYTYTGANGAGAWDLYMKAFEIKDRPYVNYDPKDRDQNHIMYPQMRGKKVFMNGVKAMVMATQKALKDTGLTWDEIDWFVPHQANLRINEAVVNYAEIPPEKALNSIMFYGNTTAATVPLTIDHWMKEGKVKKGDLVLSAVFGSGYTWGSAIFRV